MPTQLELLAETLARHEASHGADGPVAVGLRRQIERMQRELAGEPPDPTDPVNALPRPNLHAGTRPAPRPMRE